MSMTLRLEPDLAERLRRAAFEQHVSQADIIKRAVRRELDRLEAGE
jgi:predicted transcriptional regulator